MPRTQAQLIENNFVGGFISEATGINFPPNACTEATNCVFDERGKVTRRFGYEFESGYSLATINVADSTITGFTWSNAGNISGTDFRVIQIGTTLHFYKLSDNGAVSDQKNSDTVDLTDFEASSDVDLTINACSFAATNKNLVVVHPNLEPFFITYNPTTDDFTTTEITANIRDFEGLDDTLAVDNRPTATVAGLSKEHKYNLFNQGWYFNSNAALTAWDTARTDMPSNADIWWMYKDTSDTFDAATIANRDPGNTPAPKGHYLLNVFNQDRTTASGIASIAAVTTGDNRFSVNAFFAGRVFYGGIGSSGYGNKLYFTQILQSDRDFGKCYQEQDPTSETNSILTPADGGVISIFEAETIIKLLPFNTSLLVFATNGIWAISGSEGIGFTANDYSVAKISSTPTLSRTNFVITENGIPIWWNTEGIQTIRPGNQGELTVQAISDDKIRSFYTDIHPRSKLFSVGSYNPSSATVRWLYRSVLAEDTNEDNYFDSILTYNLQTQAFYNWTIPDHDIRIHDIFSVTTDGGPASFLQVLDDDSDTVIDDNSDNVVTSSLNSTVVRPRYKLFVSYSDGAGSYNVTFAELSGTLFLDWVIYDGDGTDYESTFTTGYRLESGGMNFFQSNYVMAYLEQEDEASCFMQGVWDWTTSDAEGKWSTSQQIYNDTLTNRSLNFRRLKVRGKGRSMQLKFTSETGKPFTIVGWAIWVTGNESV